MRKVIEFGCLLFLAGQTACSQNDVLDSNALGSQALLSQFNAPLLDVDLSACGLKVTTPGIDQSFQRCFFEALGRSIVEQVPRESLCYDDRLLEAARSWATAIEETYHLATGTLVNALLRQSNETVARADQVSAPCASVSTYSDAPPYFQPLLHPYYQLHRQFGRRTLKAISLSTQHHGGPRLYKPVNLASRLHNRVFAMGNLAILNISVNPQTSCANRSCVCCGDGSVCELGAWACVSEKWPDGNFRAKNKPDEYAPCCEYHEDEGFTKLCEALTCGGGRAETEIYSGGVTGGGSAPPREESADELEGNGGTSAEDQLGMAIEATPVPTSAPPAESRTPPVQPVASISTGPGGSKVLSAVPKGTQVGTQVASNVGYFSLDTTRKVRSHEGKNTWSTALLGSECYIFQGKDCAGTQEFRGLNKQTKYVVIGAEAIHGSADNRCTINFFGCNGGFLGCIQPIMAITKNDCP